MEVSRAELAGGWRRREREASHTSHGSRVDHMGGRLDTTTTSPQGGRHSERPGCAARPLAPWRHGQSTIRQAVALPATPRF